MKTLFFTLLISTTALAETNFIGIQGSVVLPRQPFNSAGTLIGLTASSENGSTLFHLPVKTNLTVGMLANNTYSVNYNVPYFGLDKEFIFKSKASGFFPSAFLGVGYKFTKEEHYKPQEVDPMLSSNIHARVGLKMNYRAKNWQAGIVATHISNGGTTSRNIGYNMVGFEILRKI